MRRLALAALALALAGVVAAPARPARAQPAPVTIIAVGDMSPEPAAQKTDDMATAAIGIGANPARFLLLGDLQYENGTIAKYRDVRGYVASWGRPQIYGRSVPAYGNHELMDTAPVPAGAHPPPATSSSSGPGSRPWPKPGTPPRATTAPPSAPGVSMCWPPTAATRTAPGHPAPWAAPSSFG